MGAILQENGFSPAEQIDEADIIIINTCSVREKPQNKVTSLLGRLKNMKILKPQLKVGVAGCVAQQMENDLLKGNVRADFVIGTDNIDSLGDIIDPVMRGERICQTSISKDGLSIPVFKRVGSPSSFTTIMKGCDNFCSYCIVPYVRGREKSRSSDEILDEIKFLVDSGVKEITLLGQNVNSYGKNLEEIIDFPQLLYRINDVEGLGRLRFITSHPKDFSYSLMEAMRDLDKVCEYLHLPLQSGSDRILKAMNRKYSYGEYREKVQMAKEMIPELALSSDFIVGFPDESDEDYEDTLNALKEIEYETIFAFNYSVRPGTSAEKFEDSVSKEIKSKRLSRLLDIQRGIMAKLSDAYVGKTVEVMVEGSGKRDEKQFSGRNRQNKVVNFDSDKQYKPGDFVKVKVKEAKPNSLYGVSED